MYSDREPTKSLSRVRVRVSWRMGFLQRRGSAGGEQLAAAD
jgi:hypothetical protein